MLVRQNQATARCVETDNLCPTYLSGKQNPISWSEMDIKFFLRLQSNFN